jgi:hypothetical protein
LEFSLIRGSVRLHVRKLEVRASEVEWQRSLGIRGSVLLEVWELEVEESVLEVRSSVGEPKGQLLNGFGLGC